MSKLLCTCGYVISDSSDFLSYKAHLVADQDYEDVLEKLERQPFQKLAEVLSEYAREVFQCPECNNLIVLSGNARHDFAPLPPGGNAGILKSFEGSEWKGMISANFVNGSGSLFWYTNQDSGFIHDMDMAGLKSMYYEKFKALSKRNILRHSFLRIDDVVEHEFTK